MEKSLLGSVCGYANEMAKIISDTVDTDVLIVDENREVVGSAFRYLDLYSDITNTALIAGVISGNRNIMISVPKVRFPRRLACRWEKGLGARPNMRKKWGRGPMNSEWLAGLREHEVQSNP